MRGTPDPRMTMLSLRAPDERVPQTHPIRRITVLADAARVMLAPTFDAMYSTVGRPSIPAGRLLKASLLIALVSVRSERLFCEQLDDNVLYHWFLDRDMLDASFDHSTLARNRQRLLAPDDPGNPLVW